MATPTRIRVRGKNGGRRPGAGRPKGSKNVLPLGHVKAARALRKAAKQKPRDPMADEDELHPEDLVRAERAAVESGTKTDEARGFLLEVMRGKHVHRHVSDRVRAATFIIEQSVGKAPQRIIHEGDGDGPSAVAGIDIQFVHGVDKHGVPVPEPDLPTKLPEDDEE